MSQTSSSNGDAPAVVNGDGPEHPVRGPGRETASTSARHARPAARPTTGRRTGYAPDDYRFGSLRTGTTGDVPATAPRRDHRHGHQRPLLATAAIFVVVLALALFLLQAFVIQPYAVRGDAMTPALQQGDRILVLEPSLLRGSIRPGDIVVVRQPQSLPCNVAGGGHDLVLRVAAVPGSVISSVGNSVRVDGRPLRERGWYDARFGEVGSTPIRKTTLAANRYFVLADNRSNACDSRTFGPVLESSIVGEGVAVVGRQGHVSLGTL